MSERYIKRMKLESVKEIAEEHADWLIDIVTPIMREVAVTSFIHGYKHGQDKAGEHH